MSILLGKRYRYVLMKVLKSCTVENNITLCIVPTLGFVRALMVRFVGNCKFVEDDGFKGIIMFNLIILCTRSNMSFVM
jgi:hypothetical protein